MMIFPDRQIIAAGALTIASLFIPLSAFSNTDTDKPNIIIFFADDAGYADFGFHNSETHLTPSIDQLATAGTVFIEAYATSSVCSPSRAGLLTGRYQNRYGVEFNLPNQQSAANSLHKIGLPLSEITFADLAKQAGYDTALIGKWHLGEGDAYQPDKRGFDQYFGLLGDSSGYHPGKAHRIVANYKSVDGRKLPYLTDALGDEAVDFVQKNRHRPFLLYMPFNAPHRPLHAKTEYLEHYLQVFDNRKRAANAALTQSMDENVGKVLAALDDAGIRDNTLIVFTNDNGGQPGANGASNRPLRGVKGTVLEGGIKVPMILVWPDRIPRGAEFPDVVSTLDILPTLAAAMGVELPGDRDLDGINLLPYLDGGVKQIPTRTLYWKVNWASAIRYRDWKLIETPDGEIALYNLAGPGGEYQDILESNKELAQDLRDRLNIWKGKMSEPLWVPDLKWKKSAQYFYDQ